MHPLRRRRDGRAGSPQAKEKEYRARGWGCRVLDIQVKPFPSNPGAEKIPSRGAGGRVSATQGRNTSPKRPLWIGPGQSMCTTSGGMWRR